MYEVHLNDRECTHVGVFHTREDADSWALSNQHRYSEDLLVGLYYPAEADHP